MKGKGERGSTVALGQNREVAAASICRACVHCKVFANVFVCVKKKMFCFFFQINCCNETLSLLLATAGALSCLVRTRGRREVDRERKQATVRRSKGRFPKCLFSDKL